MNFWRDYTPPSDTSLTWIRLNQYDNVVGYYKYENGDWVITKRKKCCSGSDSEGGSAASSLAELTDDSDHRTVTDTEKETWNNKQDLLVSGENIKTINGATLLGSGDIIVSGSGSIAIDAALSNSSTNAVQNKVVTDALADKQDIISDLETIRTNASNAYQKPANGIPASDLENGVIPSVSGKADKVTGATNGNLAALDTNGNLTDSGKAASDFALVSSLSTVATSGSYNDLLNVPSNRTFKEFKSGWRTNSTLVNFCLDVINDNDASIGNAYLGGLSCTGLPAGMSQGDVIVEIIGLSNSNKVVKLTMTSTNVSPYHWEACYWQGSLYGWRSFELVSNKVTSLSAQSTNEEYPSAKCVYDAIPTIPTNVSSFNNDAGYLNQHQDISGKEDKPTVTVQAASVSASPVPDLTLANNTEYRFTGDLLSLNIVLPTMSETSDVCDTWLRFSSGSTATAITYDSSIKWSGDDVTSGNFVPVSNKIYNIGFWFDGIHFNAIVRGIWA